MLVNERSFVMPKRAQRASIWGEARVVFHSLPMRYTPRVISHLLRDIPRLTRTRSDSWPDYS